MAKEYKQQLIGTKILIVILLSSGVVKAQKVDSLLQLLNTKSGPERSELLYQLAYEYVETDYRRGLYYADQAIRAAMSMGDSLRIVKAGKIKALAFENLGKMDSSILISNQILPIAVRNNYTVDMESILNVLGVLYTYEAKYDKALQTHFQSLQLREKYGNKATISIALNNIGLVYYKMRDYEKALSFYERTLELRNEEENKQGLAVLLINMSLCHSFKNNFADAKVLVDRAFVLCNKSCSNFFLLNAHYSLGLISFGLKKFSDAETQFLNSYELARNLGDQRLQLDNIVYLSQIYISDRRLHLAERVLMMAEELIASGTPYNLELIKVYKVLFDLYSKSTNFEKVAFYQQKYIQLKDSIYNEELTRNLMRVESEYLERENKAKLDAQTQILALNEEVISRQHILNTFMVIIAILLAIITFILFRINQHKRTANLRLEQKVKERTIELGKNNDALLVALEEQTVVFQKVASDIKSSIATIKGLCSLGLTDSEASYGGQYIRKIEATSDQLLSVVGRTLSAKSSR